MITLSSVLTFLNIYLDVFVAKPNSFYFKMGNGKQNIMGLCATEIQSREYSSLLGMNTNFADKHPLLHVTFGEKLDGG